MIINDVRVVLQAGGQGSRLRAVNAGLPKPLVRVGGVPMIERIVRQCAAAGLNDITVVTGADGQAIRRHLEECLASIGEGVVLRFVAEHEPLGNAGVLGRLPMEPSPVLLCFADLVTDLSFAEMVRAHRKRRVSLTLACHHEDHQLTLGEVRIDGERVVDYLEKPVKRYLICSGIAMIQPDVISLSRAVTPPFGLADVVRSALQGGLEVGYWTHGARWVDVNTPELLERARAIRFADDPHDDGQD